MAISMGNDKGDDDGSRDEGTFKKGLLTRQGCTGNTASALWLLKAANYVEVCKLPPHL